MVDFVKEGRVGDEVFDLKRPDIKGKIVKESTNIYPISVKFPRYTLTYTAEGRFRTDDKQPRLCFANAPHMIDQGSPPKRETKSLEFSGNPVWAYVGFKLNCFDEKRERQVLAIREQNGIVQYLTVDNGIDNIERVNKGVSWWNYAWEIPEEDKGDK